MPLALTSKQSLHPGISIGSLWFLSNSSFLSISTVLMKRQAFKISWLDFNNILSYGSFCFKFLFTLRAYSILLLHDLNGCPPPREQWLIQTPSFVQAFISNLQLSLPGEAPASGPTKVTAGFVWRWHSGHQGSECPVFLVCFLNATWALPNRLKPSFHISFILIIILYIDMPFTTKLWAPQKTESMCSPYFCPQHLLQCTEHRRRFNNVEQVNKQMNQ